MFFLKWQIRAQINYSFPGRSFAFWRSFDILDQISTKILGQT